MGDAGLRQGLPQECGRVPGSPGAPYLAEGAWLAAGGRRRAAPPLPPPFLFQPPPALPAPRQDPLAGFLDKMAAPVGAQARKLLRDLALRPPLLAARSQVSGPLGGGLEQPLVPFRPLLPSSSSYRVRGRRGATPVERTRGAASGAHEGPQYPLLHVWEGGVPV